MKHDLINVSLQRYGTRMLSAGDSFQANRRDAKVLVALKKARHATDEDPKPEPVNQPSTETAAVADHPGTAGSESGQRDTASGDRSHVANAPSATEGEIASLRHRYQEAFGKRPYHGWSAEDLRAKIAAGSSSDA